MSDHGHRRRARPQCEPCEPRALLAAAAAFAPGDLLIGTRSAIQWRGPDGVPFVTGLAFRPDDGSLFATGFSANRILRFDAHGQPLPDYGAGYDAMPGSILFDASSDAHLQRPAIGRVAGFLPHPGDRGARPAPSIASNPDDLGRP